MNAPFRTSPRRAIEGLIGELAGIYDNYETARARAAVAAAEGGRAAYWTTERYHHAAACLAVITANLAGLTPALAAWSDPHHPGKTKAALLATLIPLNTAAVLDLAAARARLAQATALDETPAIASRRP